MPEDQRLEVEANIWVATTRPDGRPHLVPVWFVWWNSEVYFLTTRSSVKARNLLHNPRASIALESGSQPLIAECTARLVEAPYPAEVVSAFQRKYDWDISQDEEYNGMFVLTPIRWLSWNAE